LFTAFRAFNRRLFKIKHETQKKAENRVVAASAFNFSAKMPKNRILVQVAIRTTRNIVIRLVADGRWQIADGICKTVAISYLLLAISVF